MRLLVLVLLAGCATDTTRMGGAAGPANVPPAPPGYVGPHFDHFCSAISGGTLDAVQAATARILDEASRQGWELVTAEGALLCFKRPRP